MATKAQFVVVCCTEDECAAKFRWSAYDQKKKRIQEGVNSSYKKALIAAHNVLRPARKRKRKKK
jgi:hypothetical protein